MRFRFRFPGGGAARRLVTAAGAALLFTITALVPVAALAAPAEQTAPAQQATAKEGHPWLERLYQRELKILERQQVRLEKAGEVTARLETYIANQKEKGKDVTSLESALAKYDEAVATAKSQRDAAQSILATHAGFDDNGKVTDVDQARQTLRTAGKAERDFHRTLLMGVWQLRDVIADYRLAAAA